MVKSVQYLGLVYLAVHIVLPPAWGNEAQPASVGIVQGMVKSFLGRNTPGLDAVVASSETYAGKCEDFVSALDQAVGMRYRPYQQIDRPHYEMKVKIMTRMGADTFMQIGRENDPIKKEEQSIAFSENARNMDYLRVAPPEVVEQLSRIWADRSLPEALKKTKTLAALVRLQPAVDHLRRLEDLILEIAKRPVDDQTLCKLHAIMKVMGEMVGPVTRHRMMEPGKFTPRFPGSYLVATLETVVAGAEQGLSVPDEVYEKLSTLKENYEERLDKVKGTPIAMSVRESIVEILFAQNYLQALKASLPPGSEAQKGSVVHSASSR